MMLSLAWKPRNVILIAAFALVAAFAVTPAAAQLGGAANVAGVVTDDSGGALPGVTPPPHRHRDHQTPRERERADVTTGSEGRYRAVALASGAVRKSSPSSRALPSCAARITLVVGSDAALDLTLGVATLAETITVSGEPRWLKWPSPSPRQSSPPRAAG